VRSSLGRWTGRPTPWTARRERSGEIDLPNPKTSSAGMYAYASIIVQHRDVLTLPLSAIVTEGDVTVGYQTFCSFMSPAGSDARRSRSVSATTSWSRF